MQKILIGAFMIFLVSGLFHCKNVLPFRRFDSAIIRRPPHYYLADSLVKITLNRKEFRQVEVVLEKAFEAEIIPYRNSDTSNRPLHQYTRQYYGYINSHGERCVFVCCFLKMWISEDWRKSLIFVDDGGDSIFRVWINLDRQRYDRFETNTWACTGDFGNLKNFRSLA